MPRVEPLPRESLSEYESMFQMIESRMGFAPSSMLTMACNPALLKGFAGLAGQILGPGRIEPELKSLVSYVAIATRPLIPYAGPSAADPRRA